MKKRSPHELVAFLAMYAVDYAKSFGLDGLHPRHYDLMEKYGARMVSFKRATNAEVGVEAKAEAPRRRRAQSRRGVVHDTPEGGRPSHSIRE